MWDRGVGAEVQDRQSYGDIRKTQELLSPHSSSIGACVLLDTASITFGVLANAAPCSQDEALTWSVTICSPSTRALKTSFGAVGGNLGAWLVKSDPQSNRLQMNPHALPGAEDFPLATSSSSSSSSLEHRRTEPWPPQALPRPEGIHT